MVVECRRPREYFLQWISIALFLVMRDPPTVPFLAKAATRSLCYHRAEELGKDDIDDVLVHTRACIGTWLSRDGALAIFSSLPTSLLLSRHTSIPQRTSSTYSQQIMHCAIGKSNSYFSFGQMLSSKESTFRGH